MAGNRGLNTYSGGYQVTFNHDTDDLGRGDQGGPWLLERTEYSHVFGYYSNGLPHSGYKGPTLPWDDNTFGIPIVGALQHDSSYYSAGAKAIAATEPTSSIFNGSVALSETLRDGLPSLVGVSTWEDYTFRARKLQGASTGTHAGNEFLNVEFGWLPFVSDLRNLGYAAHHSSEIVSNYRKHAGVKIRRRLLISDTLTQQTEGPVSKPIRTFGSKSVGSTPTDYSSSLRERMWFAGAYQYHMPMDDSMASRFKRYRAEARKLYGIELTPEVVWNIAPWSWAVDWKTDVGSIIHNWSALGHNGLVLQYGYIMHEQTANWTAQSSFGTTSQTYFRKRRVAANPYGFGVSLSGLNTQQVAVLAALGLTRADAKIAY